MGTSKLPAFKHSEQGSTMRLTPYSICYFSSGGMELPSLSEGVLRYRSKLGDLKVTARTGTQLFDKAQHQSFVRQALKHDVIIIRLHGGKKSFPAYDLLIDALTEVPKNQRPYLHIQPTGGDEDSIDAAKDHSPDFGTPEWDQIKHYLECGGFNNFYNLLSFLNNRLFQSAPPFAAPEELLNEGIYHPDFDTVPTLEDYLEHKIDPDKPTIGIWFYQTYWLNNNLEYIDYLVRSIEAQGANVIPVFHLRFKDKARGNNGSDHVVDHFFMDQGKPRIQALISPMMFSLTLSSPDYLGLLKRLGVPCLQAMLSSQPYAAWNESVQGMATNDVSFSAAQPEFDGNLITVPVATREQNTVDPVSGGLLAKYKPIEERSDKLVKLSINWARLSHIPNHERKVAIIFHHYPPRNDRIGCAAGLDSFASVKILLDSMAEQGYRIDKSYADGTELADEMLSRMTVDQRWLTPDQMAERAEAKAGPEHYLGWNKELPQSVRSKMSEDWGDAPGDLFVYKDEMLFAGLENGNTFLSIQPPRGYFENIDKAYHDLYLSTPHHYLAQYRWIRDVFKADVVMHIGKHGSLEWLPGKALGLSERCYPDLAIMELPNVYPYIINDPSEGTQAKRRSYACIIDHLPPASTNADLYEDLSKVQNLIDDYNFACKEDPNKIDILRPLIWEAVEEANIHHDLDCDRVSFLSEFDGYLEQLHAYLHELSDTMINDGLHIFGQAPSGDRLVEYSAQLTRIANGEVPSLREAIITSQGYDYDDLLDHKGKIMPHYSGQSGAQLIATAHKLALMMISELALKDYTADSAQTIAEQHCPIKSGPVAQTLEYIAENLVPNIRRCREEIDASLTAISGGFVEPGPSGSPSRGQADILPTGRNFYSVDPNKIPSPAAWEVGKRLGDALIERYLQENSDYPDSVGILVYGGATMRTRGDDIAEIFYLMGLKPVWQKSSGNVIGLEVIPSEQLGRPRLDVTPRVSGFFRDAFPNLMERIDEAVAIVASLNEPPETNMLRRNVLVDLEDYTGSGMSADEAWREATFRVFSCPPGTYGAGVSELVESKNWETQEDLANNYIRYSAHAYGKESYGVQKPDNFRKLLARMDVTVKNEDSREYDMMSCTDYYNYYGGLIVAAKTERGSAPLSMMGDSADPKRVRMRSTAEEAKHILRSRLVNPKWLDGMKRHGYKGAGDISHMMDVVLGWDATADVIDDWMYESIARKYALDQEMKDWMQEVNPYAMQNILDKLLEAISRNMWNADQEMEDQLRDAYLEMEGEIEERTE